jgi:hypothetical protein|tara:strand:- start:5057 stop:5359 length:303 start_codon:yes stop_codon:yes gene_type:complete
MKKITPHNLELIYDEVEDLQKFYENPDFVKYVLGWSVESIEEAIESKKNKVEIFNIVNLSLIVEVKRSQFPNIIQKLIDIYVEEEDYDKCAELQTLIEKI